VRRNCRMGEEAMWITVVGAVLIESDDEADSLQSGFAQKTRISARIRACLRSVRRRSQLNRLDGGEGGIRTHGWVYPTMLLKVGDSHLCQLRDDFVPQVMERPGS
jgi:hypothetical protein